jgi:DNA-binding CsgD family transcriptional regulator
LENVSNTDMNSARLPIALVAGESATFGHALSAALTSRGWVVQTRHPTTGDVSPSGDVIVVVEDDHGNFAAPAPATGPRSWIFIGTVRSLERLLTVHGRGAVVLNQSAPMLSILRHIEHVLERRPTPVASLTGENIRCRITESESLARLTAAEDAVLRAMLAGASAAQIGMRRCLSINTVRSQIRSITLKLGVRSQLEAVAVAHRSGWKEWMLDAPVHFTNCGEDEQPSTPRE